MVVDTKPIVPLQLASNAIHEAGDRGRRPDRRCKPVSAVRSALARAALFWRDRACLARISRAVLQENPSV